MNAPSAPTSVTPSLRRRLAVMLYETFLLAGVLFAAGLLFVLVTQAKNPQNYQHLLQLYLFAVMAWYFAWFWMRGQTLAMKTWHIHLRTAQGEHLTVSKALLRYAFSWVWFLPPLALAWTLSLPVLGALALTAVWMAVWAGSVFLRSDRQFWHDNWTGTQLIYLPPPPKTKLEANNPR